MADHQLVNAEAMVSSYLGRYAEHAGLSYEVVGGTGRLVNRNSGPFTSILAQSANSSGGRFAADVGRSTGDGSYVTMYSTQSTDGHFAYDASIGKVISKDYAALYGVARPNLDGWTRITTDNGETMIGWVDRPVALYGVAPIPVKPPFTGGGIIDDPVALYGVPPFRPITSPVTISITEEEIKENISVLKKSANTMETSWEEIKGPILSSIKESWASDECNAYVAKIEKMDKKVSNSIDALRLLAKTYEKSLDLLSETRESIKTAISNL